MLATTALRGSRRQLPRTPEERALYDRLPGVWFVDPIRSPEGPRLPADVSAPPGSVLVMRDPDAFGHTPPGLQVTSTTTAESQEITVLDQVGVDRYETKAVLKALNIVPGQAVADIGAGTGHYSQRFTEAVGPEGHVWATDINECAMFYLGSRLDPPLDDNVTRILQLDLAVTLPEHSVDLAWVSNVHQFHYPERVPQLLFATWDDSLVFYRSIRGALRPGGRLAVMETWKDTAGGIPVHAAGERRIVEQVEATGFTLDEMIRIPDPATDRFSSLALFTIQQGGAPPDTP